MYLSSDIQQSIATHLGIPVSALHFVPAGGGSINECYIIRAEKANYFCKINSLSRFPFFFEREAAGLETIANKNIIRTPSVIAVIHVGDVQVLLLEFIGEGMQTDSFWQLSGERLALLHSQTNDTFGLASNNYMGALQQDNTPSQSWVSFFTDQRLRPQVIIAIQKKLLDSAHAGKFERLYEHLPSLFPDERPSLLHGDLWSGNFLCDGSQQPVLIDPAVYYGSRHMDLAMTTLFGGFEKAFYDSYHYHFPLRDDHTTIWRICNLYPLLIHLNLFGRSYLGGILSVLNHF